MSVSQSNPATARYIRRQGLQTLFEEIAEEVNRWPSDPADPAASVQALFEKRLAARQALKEELTGFRDAFEVRLSDEPPVTITVRAMAGRSGAQLSVQSAPPLSGYTASLTAAQRTELLETLVGTMLNAGALRGFDSQAGVQAASCRVTCDGRQVAVRQCPGVSAGAEHPEVRRAVNLALDLIREYRFTSVGARHVDVVF
jgi:hypothetical protein